ncbi:MAG: UDP-N-acetylmuramate--L-alanine ligase [Bacteroidales bacterium]
MLKDVYFLGIGGIGMSAIARYYNHAGYNVAGYDRTPSRITDALESEGIKVHFTEKMNEIPEDIATTLVIYTPAIPHDNKELEYVIEKGYRLIKRSKALGEIAKNQKCLAISGTHGKTSTSTLLAHILTDSGEGCNAFLGGISKNYHTNLLLSKNNVLVAEADEFDRSFLQLSPQIAVVTAADADHLDIYKDVSHVREAFCDFASQVSDFLLIKKGINLNIPHKDGRTVYEYSFDSECDFYAADLVLLEGGYFDFSIVSPWRKIEHCRVGVPGWVNVENAVAAGAVALLHGLSDEQIRHGLKSFKGVERRFDIHINTKKCIYIDDYAHHPNEISASISSIRGMFPGRKICGIFQPHLFTRTQSFYKDFAKSLSSLDEVLILPIYPAREEPIKGVTSELIFDLVSCKKELIKKDELMNKINNKDIDILVSFGAGDIDRFINPITELLRKKYIND